MATGFCCSIETEPRTLKEGELSHVREVAVGIFNEKQPSEASHILNQGMKPPVNGVKDMTKAIEREDSQGMKPPVIGVKEMTKAIEREDSVHKFQDLTSDISSTGSDVSLPVCQCSLLTAAPNVDSPDKPQLKEPLSAPF